MRAELGCRPDWLPFQRLPDGGDGDAMTYRLLATNEALARMLSEAPLITLTDDYVPVDQMLASVHREETPK